MLFSDKRSRKNFARDLGVFRIMPYSTWSSISRKFWFSNELWKNFYIEFYRTASTLTRFRNINDKVFVIINFFPRRNQNLKVWVLKIYSKVKSLYRITLKNAAISRITKNPSKMVEKRTSSQIDQIFFTFPLLSILWKVLNFSMKERVLSK